MLRPTRHGPGGTLQRFIERFFLTIGQLEELWDHRFKHFCSTPSLNQSDVSTGKKRYGYVADLNCIKRTGGSCRLSPPLPTFRVRYTRRVLKATEKEILKGSQQRLGRVTVTVSVYPTAVYSLRPIFFRIPPPSQSRVSCRVSSKSLMTLSLRKS